MTDQLDQQLSAFMDDELPEQECELFVRQLCKEDGLQQTVNRYALMGDAMRGELLAADVHLSDRIQAAIAESSIESDSVSHETAANAWPAWLRPVTGVAVAATVAAVSVLSLQGFGGTDNSELPASTVADIRVDDGTALLPVSVPQIKLPEVRQASAVPQSRMDQYLLRHREYANGFGRQSVMGVRDVGSYRVVPVPAFPVPANQDTVKRAPTRPPAEAGDE